MLLIAGSASFATAHEIRDDVRRTAVVSAFAPELSILKGDLAEASTYSVNGVEFSVGTLQRQDVVLFLSGISIVNAAMTTQLALDHFNVEREVEDEWSTPPFFEYPYANFGMMFPRSVTVQRADADAPETRFWFPADDSLLATARVAAADVALGHCSADGTCLPHTPTIVFGGAGVSRGAFVDNAAFREYTFDTFDARVLDMESAAVLHVAYANDVPFIAVRSLSDLAGGAKAQTRWKSSSALRPATRRAEG